MAKEELLGYTHLIDASLLEQNDGQLEGLPKNPRYIKDERFAKLKLSLEQSPEFLEANPLKVYPLDNGHYIIIGGNMRFLAGREVGIKEFPCYIFKKETPVGKLKEFLIKDNIAFGNTDWDALANDDWEVGDLEEWGMDISFLKQDEWEDLPQIEEEQQAPSLEKDVKITITVPAEEKDLEAEIRETLKSALEEYKNITIA